MLVFTLELTACFTTRGFMNSQAAGQESLTQHFGSLVLKGVMQKERKKKKQQVIAGGITATFKLKKKRTFWLNALGNVEQKPEWSFKKAFIFCLIVIINMIMGKHSFKSFLVTLSAPLLVNALKSIQPLSS